MIFGSLVLLAASAAPIAADEAFKIGSDEMNGPCSFKIEGRPPEEPPTACAAAIAAAASPKEKAILYFAWSYSLNGAGAALQALPNLDKAIALAPNFTNARHERAYTLNDLGYYDRALIDGDRDVALEPDRAEAYRERALARHRLAYFAGSLADRLKDIELSGSTHAADIAVIEELMWLGRYDEAAKRLGSVPETDEDKKIRGDIARRRQFKADGGEAKRCALGQSVDDRAAAQKTVDDCIWAFDHEADRSKRADYLTTRAVNSVIAFQDRDASVPLFQIAAALDPKNPERHMNYGSALIGVRHSWAARNEFELALAHPDLNKRDKALALAGRGQARANLGDPVGAFKDAKESFEIEPMEPNVWLLGDLASAKGDKETARKLWMMVYHMGGRDDSLIQQLKSVGIDHPEKEPR
jgi:tetratricopeptide (TPR) repeat protein